MPKNFDGLSRLVAGSCMLASSGVGSPTFAATQAELGRPAGPRVHAFRLYTGADNNSHVQEGSVPQGADFPVVAVEFQITPPHAPPVWHNDPQRQYVVTMTGTLKFSTRTGEGFVLRPGDVLIAEDDTGSGHGWEMLGDEPWTRTYAILPPNQPSAFVPFDKEGGRDP